MTLRRTPILLLLVATVLLLSATGSHAAAPNLIINPEREADLSSWSGQGGALSWVTLDVFGRADSGSAQLAAALGTNVTLAQCVALPANAHVDFGAWVEIPSFQEVTGSAVVKLEWWSELSCGGTQLDVATESATITATGRWSYAAQRNVTASGGAKSAKLRAISQPDAQGFLVEFDSLFVAPAGELFVPAVGEIVVADGSQKIVKVEPQMDAAGKSIRVASRDLILIEGCGLGAERGEGRIVHRRVAAEFRNGVPPHHLRSAGVEVGLQCLLGSLLRQEAGEVPARARRREVRVVEVAPCLLEPPRGLGHGRPVPRAGSCG